MRAVAVVALAACLAAWLPSAAQQTPAPDKAAEPWRVVLLRGWDALYAVNLERERAMRVALTDASPRAIEFYTEDIDSLRFTGNLEPEFARYLKRKYSGMHVDLVMPSGDDAFDFVERHREEIWPGAPVVFYGLFEGARGDAPWPPATTGVTLLWDFAGTVDLARTLMPDAERVYVISGTAPSDRLLQDVAMKQLASSAHGLEVRLIVGTSREEMLERVAHLDSRSFVLYLSMLRDGKNQLSGPEVTPLDQIVARSSAPVFSAVQSQWRRGPIGGLSSRIDEHGRVAGLVARRVLEGTAPEAIPVKVASEPVCVVNAQALGRWNLPMTRVPSSCTLTHVVVPAWRAYFWQFVALVAIIVLQFALISALVIQSRRRRKAEIEAHTRGVQMAQVARLSTVGALTASIAHEINQPMGAILSNAEAAETMLARGELRPELLREILADIRTEDLRASEVIKRLRKLLSAHEWNPSPLEVNTEVAEALRHLSFEAAKRGVTLVPEFAPTTPAIIGDSVNLQQVVMNLVMNAIDAVARTPAAPREVHIRTRPTGKYAEIVVSDRGPGVKAEDESKLFEETFTTRKDGMGLGLSIVKTIVDMHQGTVSHESNQPRGAIFRVRIPAIGS
jgi:signal transduction histidine kinase